MTQQTHGRVFIEHFPQNMGPLAELPFHAFYYFLYMEVFLELWNCYRMQVE